MCWVASAAMRGDARLGTAVSAEAQAIRKATTAIIESAEKSHALFGHKQSALEQIYALAFDCAHAGWDGSDASPISLVAVETAAKFVRALPDDIDLPEFAPEPDGSISLDWIQTKTRLLSISAGSNDRLAYAWLDGTDCGHAVARFTGTSVPFAIIDAIKRPLNHGDVALRPA